MASVEDVLSAHTIAELDTRKNRELVTVNKDASVEEALTVLRKNNILSLPIVDTSVSDEDDAHFVGIVSIMDIISAVALQPMFSKFDDSVTDITPAVFHETQHARVFNLPVSTLLEKHEAENKKLWLLKSSSTISELFDVLSSTVHRHVLVRFEEPSEVRMVSETDSIRMLRKLSDKPAVHALLAKSLGSLGFVMEDEKDMLTIEKSHTALSGLHKMVTGKIVAALPVIDDEGKMIDYLSSSDLRGADKDHFKNVLLPVNEFLQHTRTTLKEPVMAHAHTKLSSAVNSMLRHKVHRVWIVNEKQAPVGVVVLLDIIRLFKAQQAEPSET